MDVDNAPPPEPDLPPVPVTFLSGPQKYLRNASRHALGNLVSPCDILRSTRSCVGIGHLHPSRIFATVRRINKTHSRVQFPTLPVVSALKVLF